MLVFCAVSVFFAPKSAECARRADSSLFHDCRPLSVQFHSTAYLNTSAWQAVRYGVLASYLQRLPDVRQRGSVSSKETAAYSKTDYYERHADCERTCSRFSKYHVTTPPWSFLRCQLVRPVLPIWTSPEPRITLLGADHQCCAMMQRAMATQVRRSTRVPQLKVAASSS